MKETNLKLEIIGKGNALTPLSARECSQILSPIPQGILRRTINGVLVCVGNGGHRKFQSTISCRDRSSPAFEGVWKGTVVRVHCLQFITQAVPVGTTRLQLEREGENLQLYHAAGTSVHVVQSSGQWLSIPDNFPGGFVTYQPILTMLVKTYTLETDEWGLTVGWTLELEEV